MYNLSDLLIKVIDKDASDLHLSVGTYPALRICGELVYIEENVLTKEDIDKFVLEILGDKICKYEDVGEIDVAYSLKDIGRFRINIFKEKSQNAIAIRSIRKNILTLNDLSYPNIIKTLTNKKRGLILVTGSTGTGKSTTVAAMIEEINRNKKVHIITLEEPIEYLYDNKKSIVNQREIGKDTNGYESALKSVLRQDPDIIVLGEMRDYATIKLAITAAETGHLVISTLHTSSAAKTIDRIVDVFPSSQQNQIREQLALSLEAVITQELVLKKDRSGRIAVFEIMIATEGIRNLIRQGKIYQINSLIQTGSKYGMQTMDMALMKLYEDDIISKRDLLIFLSNKDVIENMKS
ncbi:type IV pilus twitching motility protein PilT [uncultured Clostridium sp.]|uniref:type IV pilus twitching motility protein PilT n=1 Tax=uncultured Clostridium sp. TaxID=59620 RepID=UPI0025F6EB4C|nr:type IV pilus twitching motility protein PilT [uncultured Clostridium sp.]